MRKAKIREIENEVIGRIENVYNATGICLNKFITKENTVFSENFSMKPSTSETFTQFQYLLSPISCFPVTELQGVNLRSKPTKVFLFISPLQMELPEETAKEPNIS